MGGALVFVSSKALLGEFNFYFEGVFCCYWRNVIFWGGLGGLGTRL